MNTPSQPHPLVPSDVDLRDFPHTPLFRHALFSSTFHAHATAEEWRAGVTLWLKSWDQVPAGTLPANDVDLCRLAELGRDMRTWLEVREMALHGWFLCSDGRLHHRIVAEGVLHAWKRKLEQRWKTVCSSIRKANQRAEKRGLPKQDLPTFEEFLAQRDADSRARAQHQPDHAVDLADAAVPSADEVDELHQDEAEDDGRDEPLSPEDKGAPPTKPKAEHVRIGEKVAKVMGVDNDPNWFGDFGLIIAWLKQGADEGLIINEVTRIMAGWRGQGPPGSLVYFDKPIVRAIATRNRTLPEISDVQRSGSDRRRQSHNRFEAIVERDLAGGSG
ncbi:DUF1376 domain-containing protein [Azospirillum brasilense]|uniref:DUF1376 domain-containing protein n=1 Tax=Azospirillum brasilense TaxID=192 RepID=UPI000E6A2076|nr:DUF1376 domain-containing protein [Azospirillum brasilense]NUB25752.1 DUF1376 domain-containing protein [Azospirillum brasilense]NUB33890.1 DUF1376 domain-containing protein [Azospirillum brasilense]RIW07738.1 DUF1376 domain-containing protein [Azospirillum brasilense]